MSELYGVMMTVKIQVVLWHSLSILFIRWLKFLFLSFNMLKSTILTNFCIPEILGLGRR